MVRGLQENDKCLKKLSPSILKSLDIYFNPLQNVWPILLLNRLMMVTNEGSIAWTSLK